MNHEIMVSTGGTYLNDDILRLMKTVHILIGTPGRILDLAQKNCAKLDQCKFLVLDEVDKLLSVDFQPIICKLIQLLHPEAQKILVSATYP
jgi:ATP-dependent RNA helicase DDX6/DHH1